MKPVHCVRFGRYVCADKVEFFVDKVETVPYDKHSDPNVPHVRGVKMGTIERSVEHAMNVLV